MKKRCTGFLLAYLLLVWILPMGAVRAVSIPAAPYLNITYGESSTVSAGTIRYVSQLSWSPNFRVSYWSPYEDSAGHECYTADISMALSSLGLNATPATLGIYWTERGHTGGEPFTTVAWDVGAFGATYLERSFAKAMDAYMSEPSLFSPPIIHLTTYSVRGHYVMVVGRLSQTQFLAVDPANDYTWTLTIEDNAVSYLRNGETRTEKLKPVTQFKRTGSVTYVAPTNPTVPQQPAVPTPAPTAKPEYHSDGLPCASAVFADVPGEQNWAHEGIDYCIKNGLMLGMDVTRFGTNAQVTRAMIVTVLYRAAGSPNVSDYPNPFTDAKGGWYKDAVIWAYHNGITVGVQENRFAPAELVTREQLVAMLYRFRQLTAATPAKINALDPYEDGSQISSWAQEPMRWAVTSGILTGVSATELRPGGAANRAQMATILLRFQNT